MQLEYVDVVFANRPDSNTPMEGEFGLMHTTVHKFGVGKCEHIQQGGANSRGDGASINLKEILLTPNFWMLVHGNHCMYLHVLGTSRRL